MHIIKYKQLQFRSINYYPIDHSIYAPLSYVYGFLSEAYVYIQRKGVLKFLKEMDDNKEEYEYIYDSVSLSTDYENKLFYLHDTEFDYCRSAKTPELMELLDNMLPLQACQQNLIDYICLTQENFNQIIIHWDDVMPFDTKQAMEQFVADHAQL